MTSTAHTQQQGSGSEHTGDDLESQVESEAGREQAGSIRSSEQGRDAPPGVFIADGSYLNDNYPRDDAGQLETRSAFSPDPAFWTTLRENLGAAESFEEQLDVLKSAVRDT